MLFLACQTQYNPQTDPNPEHKINPPIVSETPTSQQFLNDHIEATAVEYRDHPIPRTAFYDFSIPPNLQEYKKLDGYGLLLIVAISKEVDELPLKRVYVSLKGEDIILNKIKIVWVNKNDPDSQSVKTFGPYRAETLFLFPIYLAKEEAVLKVDFAKNRNEFVLMTFPNTTLQTIINQNKLPVTKPRGPGPSYVVLRDMIELSYPEFLMK